MTLSEMLANSRLGRLVAFPNQLERFYWVRIIAIVVEVIMLGAALRIWDRLHPDGKYLVSTWVFVFIDLSWDFISAFFLFSIPPLLRLGPDLLCAFTAAPGVYLAHVDDQATEDPNSPNKKLAKHLDPLWITSLVVGGIHAFLTVMAVYQLVRPHIRKEDSKAIAVQMERSKLDAWPKPSYDTDRTVRMERADRHWKPPV